MRIKFSSMLLVGCLISIGLPANAQPIVHAQSTIKGSPIPLSLKRLCNNGAYEQAYQLATQALEQWEGDPEFDFYYGLAALETGRVPESQFVYERLVTSFPDQRRYRLEYGRSLYLLAQYDAAREQFQQVSEQQPPLAVQENIERYLSAIQRQQRAAKDPWSGFVSVGGGYDSNINNATALTLYDNSILNETAREIESAYFSARTQVNYQHRLTQQQSLNLGGSTSHKLNSELSDFDIDTLMVKTFWQLRQQTQTLKLGASYLELLLSGNRYRQDSTLFAEWQSHSPAGFISQGVIALTQKNYPDDPTYESTQPLLSWTFLLPKQQWLQAFSMFAGTDQARKQGLDNNMRDFAGLNYRLSYRTNPSMTLTLAGSAFWSVYQDRHPVFARTRRDHGYQFNAGLDWQLAKQWLLKSSLGYTDNQSNLVLYEYDRHKFEVKLQWQF